MARRVVLSIIIATVTVLALVPSDAETEQIDLRSSAFSPRRVTIDRFDTVRWNHRDDVDHSVTASSGARANGESFDSSRNCPGGLLFDNCMDRGDKFSHTFTTSGTFTYYCKIHGIDAEYPNCGMCGQVLVRGPTTQPTGPGSSPSPTIRPRPTGSGSVSPSPTSTSPSPTTSVTTTGTAVAGGQAPGDGSGNTGLFAVAGAAVAVLAASGFLVYRTLIRG